MRWFVLWLVSPFMVALSPYGILHKWEKFSKISRYKFFTSISFALLQSNCFNFSVHSRLFCLRPFLQMPYLYRYEKLHVRIVVPKLQSSIFPVTRRVALLVHCIVSNVPISPQNPKMICITILLRSSAPRNLMSPSSVNFVIKSFQDYTLYVNIKTLNTECKSDQEQMWMWNIQWEMEDHRLREELRSCQRFLVDSELERAGHKVFNYAIENINAEIVDEELDHFFNNLKCAAKVDLVFGFILRNIEDGGFRYFYAHENNTILDRFQLVCSAPGRTWQS